MKREHARGQRIGNDCQMELGRQPDDGPSTDARELAIFFHWSYVLGKNGPRSNDHVHGREDNFNPSFLYVITVHYCVSSKPQLARRSVISFTSLECKNLHLAL